MNFLYNKYIKELKLHQLELGKRIFQNFLIPVSKLQLLFKNLQNVFIFTEVTKVPTGTNFFNCTPTITLYKNVEISTISDIRIIHLDVYI